MLQIEDKKLRVAQVAKRLDVSDKTILISGDWYNENMILFIRYAHELKQKGATVVVQTPAKLEGLFNLCPFIDKVLVMGRDKSYPHHAQIPITSFPKLFKTIDEASIPANVPYLYADEQLIKQWHNRLGTSDVFRVGIHLDGKKYPIMARLLELAHCSGVDLYILNNLQETVITNIPDDGVIHLVGNGFCKTEHDILNLAAIIKNLDMVITGDSVVAHLAGALNTPVWVLLPRIASWRWQEERTDSPWYPSMRLFRQTEKKTWDDVVEKIKQKLDEQEKKETL